MSLLLTRLCDMMLAMAAHGEHGWRVWQKEIEHNSIAGRITVYRVCDATEALEWSWPQELQPADPRTDHEAWKELADAVWDRFNT